MNRKLTIVFVTFSQSQVLDLVGPIAVFSAANNYLSDHLGYNIKTISAKAGQVTMNAPVTVMVEKNWAEQRIDDLDILLVAGGMPGTLEARSDPDLKRLIVQAHNAGKRVGSICTGAFILASAGILDRRKCTTHWKYMEQMRREYSSVNVIENVIFHTDQNIWTSAGVTAGMDMALAMVAEDFGAEVARHVAKDLVMFVVRPGPQAQVSENLKMPVTEDQRFRDLMLWIRSNPSAKLDVTSLAERCNMSTRTFTRRFGEQFDTTPAKAVEVARVGAAQYYLSNTDFDLKRIAGMSGFPSTEAMGAAFKRQAGRLPSLYREEACFEEARETSVRSFPSPRYRSIG